MEDFKEKCIDKVCPNCKTEFKHYKNQFCSKKCSNQYRRRDAIKSRICAKCSKEYKLTKELGNLYTKYCSRSCFTSAKIVKYKLDTNIKDPKILGKLWSSVFIRDLLEIRIYGTLEFLESIAIDLSTNYPIKKTRSEVWDNYFKFKYKIVIYNREFVSKLLEFGIEDPIYREWPLISEEMDGDFFSGYCDSAKKVLKEDEIWVWMISKNFARAAEDKFSGYITYNEGDWWWIKKV